jgi:hypothetical protein
MKRTTYQRAVLFERVLSANFFGILACTALSFLDSTFIFGVFLLALLAIFGGIWYGILVCPTCGRPISWRRSRHEELARRCRGCKEDLDK